MSETLEPQKLSNKLKRYGGNRQARNYFQRQSFTKYLRKTLLVLLNCSLRENFILISIFHEIFAITYKILISE